ncbi:MAG TPA: dihydrodipicolinate synthase family protein [Burkholderiales bacterium]
MADFELGLVHTPVTPFTRAGRVDFDVYGKLIEFHLRNGADALALPMHAGESVSLTEAERHALIEFAIKQVRGRVPVLAHVSDAGTGIAAAYARHAEAAGAAAVVATTPYYWTPPPAMVLEHFARIGAAVTIPFLVHHAPEEMAGTRITAELALKLMERAGNFAGVVDSSLDWQFMVELVDRARRPRPAFQLLPGVEYMVSAGAIGAKGAFSSLAAIAPGPVRRLYDLCGNDRLFEARGVQEEVAALLQILKKAGTAGLKGALRAMGRDCGDVRPPLRAIGEEEFGRLSEVLAALPALRSEPRGW